MNPQALLEQLAPLRTPDPVGWWPLAPGWWAVILLAAAMLGWGLWVLWQRRARNQYRRLALQSLQQLEADGGDAAALNQLLKAVALQVFGSKPARLSGDAWVAFLVDQCPQVSRDGLAPLGTVYAPRPEPVSHELLTAARVWLERHEVAHV